ncbi:NAD(P)-binding protein [Clavulina sp. PMI_390]|nr:NAD(P)-binding protein [Clavulina sp. PMI_390]
MSSETNSAPTAAPSATSAAPPKPKVASTPKEGSGKLLKADDIAALFRADIASSIASHFPQAQPNNSDAPTPKLKLVGILAGGTLANKPSELYAQFTQKQCEALGVEYVLRKVDVGGEDDQLGAGGIEEAIVEANRDDSVHGIMVYYPIFGGLQDHYLQQVVTPSKDVEGLNVKFHYNLYHNIRFISPGSLLSATTSSASSGAESAKYKETELPHGIVKSILPCTPLAIVKSLEYMGVYNKLLDYGDRAYGKTVTVINRSEVVGRPLAALLANDGARVFSVDIDTIQEFNKRPSTSNAPRYHAAHVVHPSNLTLQECLALSDVVVSAVPSATYKVKTEWLKSGCVCVNVASEKNFEITVRERASMYLPAVGKVTILMLLRNLLRLCEYQEILDEKEIVAS